MFFFSQISVPEDGSTFMNQICNFVGLFIVWILLYNREVFDRKPLCNTTPHVSYFHWYIFTLKWFSGIIR